MKPSGLPQLVQVYHKTRSSTGAASASTSETKAPTNARDKAAAEDFKSKGNAEMAAKSYDAAIASYGKAIELDGSNPVYYSNRAAAYSQAGKQDEAIADATKAAEVDPTFSKAYSRLGHAYYCAGRFQESVDAYQKGIELDPNNQVMKNSLATAKGRLPASQADTAEDDAEDEVAAPADRGAGGFPNFGGGMPDLSSILSNPAMMQMAQSMMQNGGLERLMQDPSIRQMAESFGGGRGGGGGMPDLASLMNNPALRNMAEQFGRGRGAGAGGNDSNMHS